MKTADAEKYEQFRGQVQAQLIEHGYTEEELKEALKTYDYDKPYLYTPKGVDGFTIIKYISECQWFAVIDYQGGKNSILSTMLFKNLMICLIVLLVVLVRHQSQ